MNLPIQGPVDPREDHHNKEDISPSRERLLRQQECIHDYQEIGGDLAQCRICGHRSRFGNIRNHDRIMIRLVALPEFAQTMFVPREMLDQYIVDHFDRYCPKEAE